MVLWRNCVLINCRQTVAFGKSAGALDGPDFTPIANDMIVGVSEFAPVGRQFSKFIQISQSVPVELVRVLNPVLARFADFKIVSLSNCKIFDMITITILL